MSTNNTGDSPEFDISGEWSDPSREGGSPRHQENSTETSTSSSRAATVQVPHITDWWKYSIVLTLSTPIVFGFLSFIVLFSVNFNSAVSVGLLIGAVILFIVFRLLLPYTVYKDAWAVRLVDNRLVPWNPSPRLYMLGTLLVLPPLELLALTMYLVRRRRYVGRPAIFNR